MPLDTCAPSLLQNQGHNSQAIAGAASLNYPVSRIIDPHLPVRAKQIAFLTPRIEE